MRIRCILFLSIFIQGLHSQEYDLNESMLQVDARDLALGSLVCDYDPPTEKTIELTYLMPFQLKELAIRKLVFQTAMMGLHWSVGWNQSGYMDWMENTFQLHVGKELSDRLYLGVSCNLLSNENATDDRAIALFAEINSHYALSRQLSIGFHLVNPIGMQIRFGSEKIPLSSTAYLGTRYAPTKNCLLFSELAFTLNAKISAKLGMEYFLDKAFVLRMGCQLAPTMPAWGIGGTLKRFEYSWGGNLHPILGISNGLSLKYGW